METDRCKGKLAMSILDYNDGLFPYLKVDKIDLQVQRPLFQSNCILRIDTGGLGVICGTCM